jgi:hypothetical protein
MKLTTAGTSHLSINELADALCAAPPRTTIVYAVGDLAHSAMRKQGEPERAELYGLRAWTRAAYEAGEILLTQRRTDIDFEGDVKIGKCFEYRVHKRAVVRPPKKLAA